MGDQVIFANRRDAIAPLLQRCIGLRKVKRVGASLATATRSPEAQDNRAARLLQQLNSGTALSREDAREIIWLIDFLAVAEPDNADHAWQPDVLKLASGLRQDYARIFGEKSYED